MPYEVFSGLVLRECDYGENDKLLTVLTAEHGKITVLAKGVKSVRNTNAPAVQLLSYSEFAVKKNKDRYVLSEAAITEQFFSLRSSLEKSSAAQYFAQVADEVSVENNDESGMLSLTLNCLYMLTKPEVDCDLVKAVFELRCMAVSGYMPDLSGCSVCGNASHPNIYLDVMEGSLICGDCFGTGDERGNVSDELGTARIMLPVSPPVLDAMRYIVSSHPKKLFSFSLDGEYTEELSRVCEKYLVNHLERSFSTLEFYNAIKKRDP